MFSKILPIIAFSSLVFSGAVSAQPSSNLNAPISSQTQVNTPTDLQVEQFVSSVLKIEEIKVGLQAFLAEKPQEEVTNALIEQVNQEFMVQATETIEKSGLSVDQYSSMIALLEQDQHFLARVEQKVEELSAN
ncbi:DUF4168 domain-containing protein [Thiomicrospira microaerophila]|uniref:DUF4168 domain-containing protein n=1 Tax=Thiomicrospira microaerophila TaxID=406020 RepID=UPI0005C82BE3|nr:DUF4168 domain-containing protein [Thiomicrospira microaerophila]